MFVNPHYYMGPTPTNPLSVAVWVRFVALLAVLMFLMLAGTTICQSSVDTLSHGQDESEGYTHGGLVRQVIGLSQSQSHPYRHRYFRALFHAGPARGGYRARRVRQILLPGCRNAGIPERADLLLGRGNGIRQAWATGSAGIAGMEV